MTRRPSLTLVLPLVLLFASDTRAQGLAGLLLAPASTSGAPTQVFSANPFGLVMDFYNFEYEVRVAEAVTAGAGASRRGWYLFGESEEMPRLNGDVFVRYYVTGSAFNGLALGVKAGATRLPNEGTYPGLGFDLNHSYAFSDHAVVSTGIGMKRLIGRDRVYSASTITTFRLNVGFGF